MAFEADHGPDPYEKKAANDNTSAAPHPDAVALDEAKLDAMTKSVQMQRVIIDNAAVERSNEKVRNELTGKLAADIVKDTIIPAAHAVAAPKSAPEIPPQSEVLVPFLHPTLEPNFAKEKTIVEGTKELGGKVAEYTAEWLPHSPFGRFAARVERAGMRVMDMPQELAYKAMVHWRSEHAAAAEVDYKAQEKAVAEMRAELAKKDSERDSFIAAQKAAGLPTADIAMKLEGERGKAVTRVEKAQKQMDRLGKRVENINALKANWTKKEDDLANRTMAKIDQRLAPEKGAMEALTAKKAEIAGKLESLKRARDMGHQGLQELAAKLKNNPSDIDKVVVDNLKPSIEELLGRIDAEYDQHTKAMNSIDNKMRKANNYISGWMGYRNEEARITTQDRRYFNPGDQNIEDTESHGAPNLTHAPETVARTQESGERVPTLLKLEAQEYAALWNVLYGKELKINAKVFAEGMKVRQDETQNIRTFEDYIAKTMMPGGMVGGKAKYTPAELESRLKKIRAIVAEGGSN